MVHVRQLHSTHRAAGWPSAAAAADLTSTLNLSRSSTQNNERQQSTSVNDEVHVQNYDLTDAEPEAEVNVGTLRGWSFS